MRIKIEVFLGIFRIVVLKHTEDITIDDKDIDLSKHLYKVYSHFVQQAF